MNTSDNNSAEHTLNAVEKFVHTLIEKGNLDIFGFDNTVLILECGFALLAASFFYAIIQIIRHRFDLAIQALNNWAWLEGKSLKIQRAVLLSNKDLRQLSLAGLRLTKWFIIVLSGVAAIASILSVFPETYTVAEQLISYLTSAIKTSSTAILAYLPKLFMIAVIITLAKYLLSFMKTIFAGLKNSRIKISGFYPEWSDITYKLIQIFVCLLTLVLLFPYLPGANSQTFKGLSIFVGIIVSLGSTTAIANIVAGVVLTYTRAFKIDDYIHVDGIEGAVVETSMFVTRIKSYKNEVVSIPNSKMLSAHIINYSARAKASALILHTEISIGYDVPWRQVEKLLIKAAKQATGVEKTPLPYVLQKKLGDFSITYELNAYTKSPETMPAIYSRLHKNIQEEFAHAGVEILSPNYWATRPAKPLVLPVSEKDGE